MKFTIGSKFSRYISIFLTVIISLLLAWTSAKSWLAYTYAGDPPPEGLKDAIATEDGNSQFYFLLGQYYDNYDVSVPRDQVYKLYRKALELNPLNYNYWYYLAEFLSDEGKRDKALFALNQATELSPGTVALRWKAGMLATRLGDEKTLSDNLKPVIAYDPDRRKKAFIVLWQSLGNGDRISEIIPDVALPEYLNFLIETRRIPDARKVVGRFTNIDGIPDPIFLKYVSMLIDNNMIESAKEVWRRKFGEWEGVWNGNFEKGLLNAGFDWTFNDAEGAKIKMDADTAGRGNSLEIEFDGSSNVDFYHFRQNIPVKPNTRYELSAYMKSKDLTTGNGIFWKVYCPLSNELNAASEQVLGTTDWHPVTVRFETPTGCDFIRIILRRVKSDSMYGKISGTVWIDDVSLKKIQ
jgi:Carbohydrate binding domain/Tetratricopeptide repeat